MPSRDPSSSVHPWSEGRHRRASCGPSCDSKDNTSPKKVDEITQSLPLRSVSRDSVHN